MTRRFQIMFGLTILLALGLRGVQLDLRPMHTDEAVKAVKIFRPLWEGGGYHYNPEEHHGPTLAYATVLWGKLTFGRDFGLWSEGRFRGMMVAFGLGLILLLPLLRDALGTNGTLGAALLTAVSPVMVYYSRDYIHEMLLVFFTLLALAAGWRYYRTRKLEWMLLTGAAVGLMQTTKETFIFNLAAAAGAGLLNFRFAAAPVRNPKGKPIPVRRFSTAHLLAGLAAWGLVSILLFSSFLKNLSGPLDALKTYLFWGARAQGASVHVHGLGFYWQRLLYFHAAGGPMWSEGLILALALVAAWGVLARRELAGADAPFVRFLLFYSVILAAIYTALPYKTPWCALGFWQGTILLAGVGGAALLSWLPSLRSKWVAATVLLAGVLHLAGQSALSDVKYAADPRNPWTYAQTSPDLLNLVNKVEAIAQAAPEGNGVRINIIAPEDDYYPLPWYLRRFPNSGWWQEVPGYSKFAAEDIDAVGLAEEIRATTNNVSKFLLGSALGRQLGASASGSESPQFLGALLVTNLNQILVGPCLYDSNRFAGIKLGSNTIALLDEHPDGQDLIRLNRMLLEDTYTNISRNLPPGEIYPPMTIVSTQLEANLDSKKSGKMAGYFELRPGNFLEFCVQTKLWSAYLAQHQGN